jgi:DNA end-binding protein Ku
MALRSIFNGSLQLGRSEIPIKLYSAVEDRRVHFRFLSPSDHRPVTQQMVDATTGKVVPGEAIRRGFPLDDGAFVVFSSEDLKKLQPAASRDVRILQRVPAGSVPAEWFVRPYFLGPDGNAEAYLALHAALREGDDQLLAQWVMRGHEYVGLLRAEERCLSLTTLRHAGEVVDASGLTSSASEANGKEVAMARQLVEAFSDEFDPHLFKDEYAERLHALVEAKRKGKRVRSRKVAEKHATEGSLTGVLSKTLEQMHRGKSARGSAREHRKERAVA